jgi:hypothetical protein
MRHELAPSRSEITSDAKAIGLRRFEPLPPVRTDPVDVIAADRQPAPAIEVHADRSAGAALGAGANVNLRYYRCQGMRGR